MGLSPKTYHTSPPLESCNPGWFWESVWSSYLLDRSFQVKTSWTVIPSSQNMSRVGIPNRFDSHAKLQTSRINKHFLTCVSLTVCPRRPQTGASAHHRVGMWSFAATPSTFPPSDPQFYFCLDLNFFTACEPQLNNRPKERQTPKRPCGATRPFSHPTLAPHAAAVRPSPRRPSPTPSTHWRPRACPGSS